MKKFSYPCGCCFDILDLDGDSPKSIVFNPDIHNLNLDCSRTWSLIGDGNTKGCFQLESRLGRTMAKKLKPENIEQLSALISIMRPGCLEAIREGKSVSNHYIDRKNGLESIDYFHPSLKPILEPTYGEMIYQEQTMEIAKAIAGFDLQEADMLRKAIGKKKPEEMAKVKSKFIEGCSKSNIVNENQAEQIFGWIEKSQRYLFNKSHSVSYAINAYLSAYAKAHFPKVFFASYLRFAKDKIDPQAEIKELVQNASEMNINVNIPDIRLLNELFIIHNKEIYFDEKFVNSDGTLIPCEDQNFGIEFIQNGLGVFICNNVIFKEEQATAEKSTWSTGMTAEQRWERTASGLKFISEIWNLPKQDTVAKGTWMRMFKQKNPKLKQITVNLTEKAGDIQKSSLESLFL